MRLDKYLKVSRLIKRREAAKEFIDKGYVRLNGKIAKPSQEVKVDDIIEITSPLGRSVKAKIKEVRMVSTVDNASEMYELLSEESDYGQER